MENQTLRQKILNHLMEKECTAKDLSKTLHIPEKEVYDHLSHIRKSAASQKRRLAITPALCMECGYAFEGRNRFTSPGRCPRCKGEHIQDPRYKV